MIRVHRLKCYVIFLTAIGGFVTFHFTAIFLNKTSDTVIHCLDDTHIKFNESGVIDATSQWKKLGRATYVFTAYLDDREPCSALITVMGFGEKYESPLFGTLSLHNGARIRLGKYGERRILDPYEFYTPEKLGPYAYVWPLPAEVTTASDLRSIVVQQFHSMSGNANC